VGVAAAAIVNVACAMARRVGYPYDLEWMEGGMLCHALRLVQGEPIYAEPSARFVSFAYTPLYPAVLSLLAPLFGLGYAPARAVSIVAAAAALVFLYSFVRRAGGSRGVALGAAALPAAAFGPTGAWYDLARIDSLFLGLLAAAVWVGWWARRTRGGPVAAAFLMTAAFFAKQTALPFAVALGVALLATSRRAAAAYALTLAVFGGGLLTWLGLASDGWFWVYAFGLHRHHPFATVDAAVAPLRLFLLVAPAAFVLVGALARTRTPVVLYGTGLAAAGVLASSLGAGTEWSYHNALIPGVYFLAIAAGLAAAELEAGAPVFAALSLAAAVAAAPGGLVWLAARVLPPEPRAAVVLPLGYDLRPYLPAPSDRARGDALVARLAAAPGDVFVPDHGFYAFLAGKTTRLHAMNVADLVGAGRKVPADLVQEIREHRFSLVVVDVEVRDDGSRTSEDEAVGLVPGLTKHYRIAERITGPRVFSGGRFEPCCLLVPKD